MNLVYGEDERIARWVHGKIPHMLTGFENMKALGVVDDALNIIGGVVYHEYRGNDIQISCASVSRRWLCRKFLHAMFFYPFITLGCDRVSSCVPSRNMHTRRFIEGLGFQTEGVMRRGFAADDCVIYGLLREECKFIKGENNG
jgi:RimJ/RimL family protein N-acetyltransferase